MNVDRSIIFLAVFLLFPLLMSSIPVQAQPVGTKFCESSGGYTNHNKCTKVIKHRGRKVLCPVDIYGRVMKHPGDCAVISGGTGTTIKEIPPKK